MGEPSETARPGVRRAWLRAGEETCEGRVITLAECVLQVVAAIVIVVGLICSALILLLSAPGLMALFVAAFVAVTAAGSGAALLAIDFLYPGAMDVPGPSELLWLVIPASLGSVVFFDLGLEGLMLRTLQRLGLGMPGIELIEAFAGGLFTAASLVVVAHLTLDAELSTGAALAAGLISAFVRYYIGQCSLDTDLGGGPGTDSYVDLDAE